MVFPEWFKSLFEKAEVEEGSGTGKKVQPTKAASESVRPPSVPSSTIEVPAVVYAEKRAPITPKLSKAIKIWVGIDFGTSFTKLAYRVLGGAGKVIPLNLGTNLQMPYAVPSLVAFDGGRILFGNDADQYLLGKPWYEGARYLKILFAGDLCEAFWDEGLEARFNDYCSKQEIDHDLLKPGYLVAAYLAYLIRIIRIHFRKNFRDDLLINFNMCIPIDTFQRVEVRIGFQRAINVAEAIEEKWDGQRTMELLENAASSWSQTPVIEIDGSKIHLVPEAVAQMACYVNSLAAENKIHGVIDFGAGTTDFSIFNLCEDEEERCAYWYNAITFPGGMAKIEDKIATWNREKGFEMDFSQLQSAMEGISKREPEIRTIVKEELRNIWEQSRYKAWGAAFKKRKRESEWHRDKVKIFVCGGGSKVPFIREIFERCWYCNEWGPYEVTALTAPSDFEGNPKDFPRLAVAYGLTIPRPELNKYKLPKDCPNQTPPPLPPLRRGPLGPVYDEDYR